MPSHSLRSRDLGYGKVLVWIFTSTQVEIYLLTYCIRPCKINHLENNQLKNRGHLYEVMCKLMVGVLKCVTQLMLFFWQYIDPFY